MNTDKKSKPLKPFVKICGITNWPDARLAIEAGADVLGFNFYEKSPRYVSPEQAARIVRKLPEEVVAAGVFVNAHPFEVAQVTMRVGLEIAQLHGDEDPRRADTTAAFVSHVWKAFRVAPDFKLAELKRYKSVAAFLLDGFSESGRGGTGRTFDWGIAARASRIGPVVLAGGLNADNVAEAVRVAEPEGIDVCSGVESRPGKKSVARMRAFMHALEASVLEE